MSLPPPSVSKRARKLHAMLGSSNAGERENAHRKLTQLLAEHGLTWNDLPALLAADVSDTSSSAASASSEASFAASPPPSDGPQVNVFDLVDRLLELYVALTPDQRIATTLWTLHTYVFGRFRVTPRLALVSPVRGCGKTTLLVLLEQLCADSYRSDNVTPAAIYHELSGRERTLLIDEGDNLGLHTNNILRSTFNAGHRRGGALSRFVSGRSRKFPVFAPLAIAAIGALPLPIMHRAIVIQMERAADNVSLHHLDEFDRTFPAARTEIQKWAATCSLNPQPAMPAKLRNRPGDNWRVLLAIADDLGHGEAARTAAITLSAGRGDEDPGVMVLISIRTIFLGRGIDRMSSGDLVEALVGIDDAPWHAWCGPKDDRPPHKLTQSELALLLRPFKIHPRTVWPKPLRPGSHSARGYRRADFERAWAPARRQPDKFQEYQGVARGVRRQARQKIF